LTLRRLTRLTISQIKVSLGRFRVREKPSFRKTQREGIRMEKESGEIR